MAGRANLNTRQVPVLQAILSGAYKDEFTSATSLAATGTASAASVATALETRTSDVSATLGAASGPLRNISELVGKFIAKSSIPGTGAPYDGGQTYAGFSGTAALSSSPPANPPNLSAVLAADTSAAGYGSANVERFRETSIRALTGVGAVRVWNVMIDLIAQTGRYPATATTLDKFNVEGEQRYWVHLAIDRCTGQVIDKQIEIIKE